MTRQADSDVVICGAGASGLALAIDLARRDVSFRIIDRLAVPFNGSRGKGIQPRTLEIFDNFGIVDEVIAAGGPYPIRRSYLPDGSHTDTEVMAAHAPGPAEPYTTTLMIPQFRTEAILRDRLAQLGHRVDFGCELKDFHADDEGALLHLNSPEGERTIRTRWLIGADGGKSVIRKTLGIDFPGKTLGVRALVADVALTGLTRDFWHSFNDASPRQLMFCPLAGTDMFQIQGPVPLEGEIDLSADGLSALTAERTGRSDIRVERVFWASAYSMNARLADTYRKGRILLTGDAAHAHPPTGAQGLNTSVQDSFNLGWKLAAVIAGAPDGLLDTYVAERREIAAGMLNLSTTLLNEQQAGKMQRAREVHQLDIGYPFSHLNFGAPRENTIPAAGSRAPDARLWRDGTDPVRLFDLFRGTHWTLVGYHVDSATATPCPVLHIHIIGPGGQLTDSCDHFRKAYGAKAGDWFLIRPDGYIAALIRHNEPAPLADYFAFVGLPPVFRQ
jgi:2-polyprenyl-6-methoxyphenol hydroxylase-like FAD-dependent oxidoreductase